MPRSRLLRLTLALAFGFFAAQVLADTSSSGGGSGSDATAANQALMIAHLSDISGKADTTNTRLSTLEGKLDDVIAYLTVIQGDTTAIEADTAALTTGGSRDVFVGDDISASSTVNVPAGMWSDLLVINMSDANVTITQGARTMTLVPNSSWGVSVSNFVGDTILDAGTSGTISINTGAYTSGSVAYSYVAPK